MSYQPARAGGEAPAEKVTCFKVVRDGQVTGVFRRISGRKGTRYELFAGNLSWGPASAGLFEGGPEELEEITASRSDEITSGLLRAASEGR